MQVEYLRYIFVQLYEQLCTKCLSHEHERSLLKRAAAMYVSPIQAI